MPVCFLLANQAVVHHCYATLPYVLQWETSVVHGNADFHKVGVYAFASGYPASCSG